MTTTTTFDATDFTSLARLFDDTTANATVRHIRYDDGSISNDYLIVNNRGCHTIFNLDDGIFMKDPDFNSDADKWNPGDGMALLAAHFDDDGLLFEHEPVIEHVSEHMTRGELEPVLAFVG